MDGELATGTGKETISFSGFRQLFDATEVHCREVFALFDENQSGELVGTVGMVWYVMVSVRYHICTNTSVYMSTFSVV